jgi:hypothetical protein
MNILSWLFGYQRICMSALLALHEPIQRTVNKYELLPISLVKPIFHFMHQMMSFPFQQADRDMFNPVSVESWKLGLSSLAFASSSHWGADIYDDVVRLMNIGLSALDTQYGWLKEMSLVKSLNPLSPRNLHWRLKGLADIMNNFPILPDAAKLQQYYLNNRLVSTILDKVRINLDMHMNWQF